MIEAIIYPIAFAFLFLLFVAGAKIFRRMTVKEKYVVPKGDPRRRKRLGMHHAKGGVRIP